MALDCGDGTRPTHPSSAPPKRKLDGSVGIKDFNEQAVKSKTLRLGTEADRRQDVLDYQLEIYDELREAEQKRLKAIKILLLIDRPSFDTYSGSRYGTLKDVLDCVQMALSKSQHVLEAFFGSILAEEHIKQEISPDDYEVFRLFRAAICFRFGPSPTIQDAKTLINQWNEEISKGIEHLKATLQVKSLADCDDQLLLEQIIETAEQCNDSDYMKRFINMLDFIGNLKVSQSSDGSVLDTSITTKLLKRVKISEEPRFALPTPFVFICAPSGSGKSVFGINLGKNVPGPSLQWVHDPTARQPAYKPFEKLSQIIHDTLKADLDLYPDVFKDKRSTTLSYVDENMMSTPFKTVHLIVSLFEQLDKIKSSNTSLSWLQAQALLTTVPEGTMTIRAGRQVLLQLRDKWNFPLSVFIDEFVLPRTGHGSANSLELEEKRLELVRTFNRALGIIPILASTDAESSNSFSSVGYGSRSSKYMWCILVNDIPAFKLEHLIARCENIKKKIEPYSETHPAIRFLEFIKSIRLYENPLIIDLALGYLESLNDKVNSWDGSLNKLLYALSTEYIGRMHHRNAFSLGQLAYIMSHKWDSNGILVVNHHNKICTDSHMARLYSIPDVYGHPFISLFNRGSTQHYFTHELDEFVPSSFYTPFFLAPLTGLTLFGLDLSESDEAHAPLIGSNNLHRITCFEAARPLFKTPQLLTSPNMMGSRNGGTQLEVIYHAAAVFASRANGLRGCNMLEFLENFIKELEPNTTINGRKLIVKGFNEFGSRRMPLLAPMSAPGWPKSVVEMLKSCPDGQSAVYGVFKPSLDNEDIDSIIYECDAAPIPTPIPEACCPTTFVGGYVRKVFGDDRSLKCQAIMNNANTTLASSFEQEKLYGLLGKSYSLSQSSVKRIALVGECKQYRGSLNLSRLVQIVDRFDSIDDCRTFLVLSLSTSDFNQEQVYNTKFAVNKKRPMQTKGSGQEDSSGQEQVHGEKSKKGIHVLTHLNERGYYFWYVENGQNDTYELKPIPSQVPNEEDGNDYRFKDVILISCQKIWGEEIYNETLKDWTNSGTRKIEEGSLDL